jgi:hypothetical protein
MPPRACHSISADAGVQQKISFGTLILRSGCCTASLPRGLLRAERCNKKIQIAAALSRRAIRRRNVFMARKPVLGRQPLQKRLAPLQIARVKIPQRTRTVVLHHTARPPATGRSGWRWHAVFRGTLIECPGCVTRHRPRLFVPAVTSGCSPLTYGLSCQMEEATC